MANPQHIEWLKEGKDAWNARRERDDFVPDFSDISLCHNYSYPSHARYLTNKVYCIDALIDYDLSYSNFENSTVYLDLSNADLKYANLSGANFTSSLLRGIKGNGANCYNVNFNHSILEGADLRGAVLTAATFRLSNLYKLDIRDTDLSKSKYLRKDTYHRMIGNAGTKLPSRLPFPEEWKEDTAVPDAEAALETAPVQSASYDFTVEDTGVTAHLPAEHSAEKSSYGLSGQQRAAALIVNARSIAQSVSNKLGEETRADLLAYATHLEQEDPANPHRLSFIAKGIAADLSDPFVTAGYSERLKIQLRDFLDQHDAFLNETLPAAAKAIDYKDNLELSRAPTEADTAELLEEFANALKEPGASTDSTEALIQSLRENDKEITELKQLAYSEAGQKKVAQRIKRETVERATLVARLYWRARQALDKLKNTSKKDIISKTRLHAGDVAIVTSITGASVPTMVHKLADIAQAIVHALTPLMLKLQALIPVLPPVG
ncbi:Pentapeptide repeat-containing protein [Epibacterium ulvae]|uniref:Pentapeptide repeat-containing protein n=1 Tax=Epibacterium ulvae TaxID=1156985 RepID=A0A1G5QP05_9RHOB|nr:pentapeptide repeat-containing protein [Epibacterium ulvae]SCZ63472.1 Pentapeptide repeat-containing protein [Epibacterium ulvae]